MNRLPQVWNDEVLYGASCMPRATSYDADMMVGMGHGRRAFGGGRRAFESRREFD